MTLGWRFHVLDTDWIGTETGTWSTENLNEDIYLFIEREKKSPQGFTYAVTYLDRYISIDW